jgi:hypothetical protein
MLIYYTALHAPDAMIFFALPVSQKKEKIKYVCFAIETGPENPSLMNYCYFAGFRLLYP